MSGRATRRAQAEPDYSSLSKLDSLILAQTVYELGSTSWPSVAKLVSKHPLLSHPKGFFTAQSCQAMYKFLRKEASLELTEADAQRHAPLNLKLAQIHYQARILELRDLIGIEEQNFKKLVSEIEEIRSGAQNEGKVEPVVETQATVEPEDDFASDLSGLSTASSTDKVDAEESQSKDPIESSVDAEIPTDSEPAPVSSEEPPTDDTEKQAPPSPASVPEAPSPQIIELDLLKPEPEEEEEDDTPLAQAEEQTTQRSASIAAEMDTKGDMEEPETQVAQESTEDVEDATAPMEMDVSAPQPSSSAADISIETPIDPILLAEDEASRSSQAATPYESAAEPEPDLGDSGRVDDEGATSGDEPLHKARLAKAAKRLSKSSTPLQTRSGKGRRARRTSVLDSEYEPEASGAAAEETPAQTPRTVEDEASPAPEALSFRRQGKRRASSPDMAETPRERKRMRDASEPVDDEDGGPGQSTRRRRTDNPVVSKKFQNVIGMLHSQISQHRNGTIFHNPIKNSEAPDYREIVKRPMDLKTIKAKIKDGAIGNSLEFQRDIFLMFANAMMYNRPGSDVYLMTEDMMLESEGYIRTFRQTEGFVRGSH